MATKAELEAELAELKAQVAENRARADAAAQDAAEQAQDAAAEAQDAAADGGAAVELALELPDGLAKDALAELEKFATDRPLTTLLIVFLAGYALGRVR